MARQTKTSDDAKKAILQHFQRRYNRPVYVGEAACLIGWGLRDTTGMFAELVVEGKIRPVDLDERRAFDIEPDDAAFILV